ncbi:MAG: hypothetical protein M0013_12335 [Actinomycetota bacterium]|nr:hypothetical protein [Actinomycetota bacterium]
MLVAPRRSLVGIGEVAVDLPGAPCLDGEGEIPEDHLYASAFEALADPFGAWVDANGRDPRRYVSQGDLGCVDVVASGEVLAGGESCRAVDRTVDHAVVGADVHGGASEGIDLLVGRGTRAHVVDAPVGPQPAQQRGAGLPEQPSCPCGPDRTPSKPGLSRVSG